MLDPRIYYNFFLVFLHYYNKICHGPLVLVLTKKLTFQKNNRQDGPQLHRQKGNTLMKENMRCRGVFRDIGGRGGIIL